MADFLGEGSVDRALGGVTATLHLSGQALSGLEPAESESGLFSSESVLNILKLIFAGAPLSEVLTIIARLVEAQGKGMLCTIYLLDKDGRHLRCATAPSLPAQYIAQVDGTPVGPKGCNCGTAVYRREPVYVTDIVSDPLWDDYRHLALPYGLRACWSRPLISSEGKILGTFASYYREVRSPDATDLQLIANASQLVSIAIERAQSEAALKRSEAFLAEGQRLSLTGSFSWHSATDEITWSDQMYRIFEIDPGMTVTLELILPRVHPEDIQLLNEMIDWARGDGSDFEYEHRLLMPDRSVKYLHIVAHGTRDQDGRPEYIGAVQDVTERRLSEAALSKARSELAHVARVTSLGVMTASIAHEVNQPLSGIITNASTCLRMLSADPPNVDGARETARRMIRDGNRASEVITRLRALFAKKDATGESVNLNEATREVIALSSSELQRVRVILRAELGDDIPFVTGDRVQLQQVILNLLQNALDAMSTVDDRPRQLLIRTEREEGDRVRMTVQDAGVGFDSRAVDQLFEAFYTTKNYGMGIGLSVSRSIIESHHGRLWATPNDGPGATFSFSIPRRPEGVTSVRSLGAIRTPGTKNTQRVMRTP
jgi:signal transduction histidine kinase